MLFSDGYKEFEFNRKFMSGQWTICVKDVNRMFDSIVDCKGGLEGICVKKEFQ